jgi:hypothetical protein
MPHWAQLNAVLPVLNESEVRTLLAWELSHRRNSAIIKRLHQRLSALRVSRERAWLLDAVKAGKFDGCNSDVDALVQLKAAGLL